MVHITWQSKRVHLWTWNISQTGHITYQDFGPFYQGCDFPLTLRLCALVRVSGPLNFAAKYDSIFSAMMTVKRKRGLVEVALRFLIFVLVLAASAAWCAQNAALGGQVERISDSQLHLVAQRSAGVGATAQFSTDGRIVASGGNGDVVVWDAESGDVLWHYAEPGQLSFSLSPSGTRLLCTVPGGVALWDVSKNKLLGQFPVADVRNCLLSPDGSSMYLMEGGHDGTSLTSRSLESGKLLRIHSDARDDLNGFDGIKLSPDSTRLLVAAYNGRFEIFDVKSGNLVQSVNVPDYSWRGVWWEDSKSVLYLTGGPNPGLGRPGQSVLHKINLETEKRSWAISGFEDVAVCPFDKKIYRYRRTSSDFFEDVYADSDSGLEKISTLKLPSDALSWWSPSVTISNNGLFLTDGSKVFEIKSKKLRGYLPQLNVYKSLDPAGSFLVGQSYFGGAVWSLANGKPVDNRISLCMSKNYAVVVSPEPAVPTDFYVLTLSTGKESGPYHFCDFATTSTGLVAISDSGRLLATIDQPDARDGTTPRNLSIVELVSHKVIFSVQKAPIFVGDTAKIQGKTVRIYKSPWTTNPPPSFSEDDGILGCPEGYIDLGARSFVSRKRLGQDMYIDGLPWSPISTSGIEDAMSGRVLHAFNIGGVPLPGGPTSQIRILGGKRAYVVDYGGFGPIHGPRNFSVVDLTAGSSAPVDIGRFGGPGFSGADFVDLGLSADGSDLLVYGPESTAAGLPGQLTIRSVSTSGNKVLADVPISIIEPSEEMWNPPFFLGPGDVAAQTAIFWIKGRMVRMDCRTGAKLEESKCKIAPLAMSNDGSRFLVSVGTSLIVRDFGGSKLSEVPQPYFGNVDNAKRFVASYGHFSPDNRFVAISTDQSSIYDTASGKKCISFPGADNWTPIIRFAEDSRSAIVSTTSSQFEIVDLPSGAITRSLTNTGDDPIWFDSSAGGFWAGGDWPGLRYRSLSTGAVLSELGQSVRFYVRSDSIAATFPDSELKMKTKPIVWDLKRAATLRTLDTTGDPNCAVLDAGGRTVFVGCQDLSRESGAEEGTYHLEAFDLYSGAKVWSTESAAGRVDSLKASSHFVVASCDAAYLDLWDRKKRERVWRAASPGGISKYEILETSVYLDANQGGDQVPVFLDIQSGSELCRVYQFSSSDNSTSWAVVDPAGRYDASNGGENSYLHWVKGMTPFDLDQLKDKFYDPGLLAKKLGYSKEPIRDVPDLRALKLSPVVEAVESPDHKSLAVTITSRDEGGIGDADVFVNGRLAETLRPPSANQDR